MDLGSIRAKSTEFVKKYRYAGIVLMIGLVLMVLPTGTRKTQSQNTLPKEAVQTESVGDALAQILTKIDGAGKVEVLLSIAQGEETVYQTDDAVSGTESTTTRADTVIITDADRNQSGLIKQINPAKYQGAIIVCQGAESASVRLAIVNAVSNITGLGTDRISVLKMK